MRQAILLAIAASAGLLAILFLAPSPRDRAPDLKRAPEADGAARGLAPGLPAELESENICTVIEASVEIEGRSLRYPAVLLHCGRFAPGEGVEQNLEEVLLGFNRPPESAAEVLFEFPALPRERLREALSDAIGTKVSGLSARRARAAGARDLQSLHTLELFDEVILTALGLPGLTGKATLETAAALLRIEDGRPARASGDRGLVLKGSAGSIAASGFQFDPMTRAGSLKGPVTGQVLPGTWSEVLLPGSGDEPISFRIEDSLDLRTEVIAGEIEPIATLMWTGAFSITRGAFQANGRDLQLEVRPSDGQLLAIRSVYRLRVEGPGLEIVLPGLTWTAGPKGAAPVLRTPESPATLKWPVTDLGLPIAPEAEDLTLRAETGFVWEGLGVDRMSPWVFTARGTTRFEGAGLDAGAKEEIRLRLERSAARDGAVRREPTEIELRGEAWVTFADGGTSGEAIRLQRLNADERLPHREVLTVKGNARLGWRGLRIPEATSSFGQAMLPEAWTEIRARDEVVWTRTLETRPQLLLDASANVRIERRPDHDQPPVAQISADRLRIAGSGLRRTPDSPRSAIDWSLVRIELEGQVRGELAERARFSGDRFELDWRGRKLSLGGKEEAWLEVSPGSRTAAARSIALDLRLRQVRLARDVELRGEVPVLELGPSFGGSGARAGFGPNRRANLLADEAEVWFQDGPNGPEVTEVHARAERGLQFDQVDAWSARATLFELRLAGPNLVLAGAPFELSRATNEPIRDRFRARRLELQAERAWFEGPLEANFRLPRERVALDVPGFGRAERPADALVPIRVQAGQGALLTLDRSLFEGGVRFDLDEGGTTSFEGQQLLLTTSTSDPLRPGETGRKLDRAILTGRASFRTPDFQGEGALLQLASDRRRLTLSTPGGQARLSRSDGTRWEKLRFEIDYSVPEQPRVVASDFPGGQ